MCATFSMFDQSVCIFVPQFVPQFVNQLAFMTVTLTVASFPNSLIYEFHPCVDNLVISVLQRHTKGGHCRPEFSMRPLLYTDDGEY